MSCYTYDTRKADDNLYQPIYESGKCIKLLIAGTVFTSMIVNTSFHITQDSNIFPCEMSKALYSSKSVALLYRPHSEKTFSIYSKYSSVIEDLDKISKITNGWDGYKAITPESEVIDNAKRFLRNLSDYDYDAPASIEPTPYGSIVIDFVDERGLVSVEIGKSKIGWFTDFRNDHNHASEGMECSFNSIPQALEQLLA